MFGLGERVCCVLKCKCTLLSSANVCFLSHVLWLQGLLLLVIAHQMQAHSTAASKEHTSLPSLPRTLSKVWASLSSVPTFTVLLCTCLAATQLVSMGRGDKDLGGGAGVLGHSSMRAHHNALSFLQWLASSMSSSSGHFLLPLPTLDALLTFPLLATMLLLLAHAVLCCVGSGVQGVWVCGVWAVRGVRSVGLELRYVLAWVGSVGASGERGGQGSGTDTGEIRAGGHSSSKGGDSTHESVTSVTADSRTAPILTTPPSTSISSALSPTCLLQTSAALAVVAVSAVHISLGALLATLLTLFPAYLLPSTTSQHTARTLQPLMHSVCLLLLGGADQC